MMDRAQKIAKWMAFNGLIIVLVLGSLMIYKAYGAPATPQKVDCETTSCDGEWAPKKAKQFRHDKLGNAKGITIPKAMQRRIAKKMPSMAARRGAGDWFRERLKATACLVTDPVGTHSGTCDEGQKAVNSTMGATIKVMVVCGGTAVIGAVKGGGGWGAGTGGGACLYAYFADLIL